MWEESLLLECQTNVDSSVSMVAWISVSQFVPKVYGDHSWTDPHFHIE